MFRTLYTQILIMIFAHILSKMSAAWGGGTPAVDQANTGADPVVVAEENPGLATIPADCKTTSNADFEAEVLRLINAERAKVNGKPLALNGALARAARSHAMDLACNGARMKNSSGDVGRGHTGSNGSTIGQRAAAVGYPGAEPPHNPYPHVGEILAYGWPDPQGAVSAWMKSNMGHKENMLNTDWTEIGVAYARNDKSLFTNYWVVVLGNPHTSSPSSEGGGGAPASECVAVNQPDIEAEVVRLLNAERTKRGLAELDTPAALTTVARSRAADVVCGKPNVDIPDRFEAAGYKLPEQSSSVPRFRAFGSGPPAVISDPTEKIKVWVADPGASDTLFSPEYTSIGVGCAQKSGTNESYWFWIFTVRAVSG